MGGGGITDQDDFDPMMSHSVGHVGRPHPSSILDDVAFGRQ